MATPLREPYTSVEYTCKQPKYEQGERVPLRSLALGPSGAGNGVLLQRLTSDIYKDCSGRMYLLSPSIHIDHTRRPAINYIKHKRATKQDRTLFI